ncbi:GspH/FimT family pseudopilin [Alcanivorax sp. 1008]|uniref:GspH/FimT family pseudopilin n=1 Tax=Alcanivorax sp. 1008 TaxID=2816853 RepID=UPI001DD5A86D|nr:GspH/FimT family pseudopilin [Alcanivorax sp. 1008]MCC1496557.1 GspH/FimT family pseudopilin [Alcanivorax sp. 1008]
MNGKMRKQQGVTVLELMFGVAILGIMLAFAVPSFQASQANSRLRASTSDLVAAVNTARNQAVNLRIDVRIQALAGGWASGWQVQYLYPAVIPVSERSERDTSFPQSGDVNITKTGGASALEMVFQANGLMAGGGTRFDLCSSSGRARVLQVSPFGRVTNTDGTC